CEVNLAVSGQFLRRSAVIVLGTERVEGRFTQEMSLGPIVPNRAGKLPQGCMGDEIEFLPEPVEFAFLLGVENEVAEGLVVAEIAELIVETGAEIAAGVI